MSLSHENARRPRPPALHYRSLEVGDQVVRALEKRAQRVAHAVRGATKREDVTDEGDGERGANGIGNHAARHTRRQVGVAARGARDIVQQPRGRVAQAIGLREVRHRMSPGHQFQRPASASNAGPITMRTRVASASTAMVRASPSILINTKSAAMNAPNTETMISAALVITRAVRASPSAIAARSASPARRA